MGRKLWLLYPPSVGNPPGGFSQLKSALDWYWNVLPRLPPSQRPLQCVLQAGESIYVPEGWYHAVVNLGEWVGWAEKVILCIF